jgi:hypothetical protein
MLNKLDISLLIIHSGQRQMTPVCGTIHSEYFMDHRKVKVDNASL